MKFLFNARHLFDVVLFERDEKERKWCGKETEIACFLRLGILVSFVCTSFRKSPQHLMFKATKTRNYMCFYNFAEYEKLARFCRFT